ncbi:MAG: acyl-CoA carboxylase subunit beta [Chloroflexi bacterium]|nr:acyl-CoA carboxylase subunit beta [Chloroflexota bacterium]
MGWMDSKVQELRERKELFRGQGGVENIKRQHERKKLTARERLDLLLDPGSFMELDLLVTPGCSDFALDQSWAPTDGNISGHARIEGRSVFVSADDFTVLGGSIGGVGWAKFTRAQDYAYTMGVPLVQLVDTGGGRPQEQHANYGYANLSHFVRHTRHSGVIPQIALVMGPAVAGIAYGPALADFIFMVKETSYMFIAGPPVVKSLISEDVSQEDLGGSRIHTQVSGLSDLACENDQDCIQKCKELLRLLPSNNREQPPVVAMGDDPQRRDSSLADVLPAGPNEPYDMKEVVRRIVDNGYTFEVKPEYAPNLITCFARLDGHTVGIVANQPKVLGGGLDINSADKGARFMRFCDAFNIPIVNLVDTCGCVLGTKMERGGIIRHAAKLVYAHAEATVPQVTVLLRKTAPTGYWAMGNAAGGADLVFAWPSAEVGLIGVDEGMEAILGSGPVKEMLAKASDPDRLTGEMREEYRGKLVDLYKALPGRHAMDVIDPAETRSTLIRALAALSTKRVELPRKKHEIIPQ